MASGDIAQRYVDSDDDVRIAVYETGNADGPTVVLVHGWPDSHVLWDGSFRCWPTGFASSGTTTVA